jgi:hypothetical protein
MVKVPRPGFWNENSSYFSSIFHVLTQLQPKTCHKPVCGLKTVIHRVRKIIDVSLLHATKYGHTYIHIAIISFKTSTKVAYFSLLNSYYLWLSERRSYQAGVRLFSFGCISSPAYLSELVEYLYVGGKYIFPSFHPANARPLFCSILNCQ